MTAGFTRTEVKTLLAVTGLIAALLLLGVVAFARIRAAVRRSKCCINQTELAIAQFNHSVAQQQRGRPAAFLRGTEDFCRSPNAEVRLPDAALRTDGSRALIALGKGGYIDSMHAFACPSDPLVVVLEAVASQLAWSPVDFPAENAPVAERYFDSGEYPVHTQGGRTFYSYSMQAGSMDEAVNPSPAMLASLPLFSDRNPWSRPLGTLTGTTPTADAFDNGNSWNHNREGQAVALRDGSTAWLSDARTLELPVSATAGASKGFDYLYGDDPVSAAPPSSAAAAPLPYTGVGSDQPPRAAPWGCFLFD